MCIKMTSEKGKPTKANAESDFSNIPALFHFCTGKSEEILQNQRLSFIQPYTSSGSSGVTPTDGNNRSGEGTF